MLKSYTLILLGCLAIGTARAQDPQFSQFYAAPLYLNPAFAGSALAPRITVNYRNQWPSVTNYVTSMVSIDHFFERYNSGVGLTLQNDDQGQGRIRSTDIGLHYAYQFRVAEQTFVRLGVQGSYVNRTINWFGLTFGDQYNNGGFTGNPTTDPVVTNGSPKLSYVDFSTGGLVYSDWYWVGVSAHHLSQPNQGVFVISDDSRLPLKGSLHAGLRIPFAGFTGLGDEWEREKTISPAVNYRFQGKYDQLDVGCYLTYSPAVFGLWYRGLPLKRYAPTITNRESLVVLAGFRQDNFSIGYSYDATISSLGPGSGGAHEISISYTFDNFPPGKPKTKRRDKQLSCPKF
ncbi:PorP/SprF family type IX secretion system membrane protein [Larkinella soli]|uniref:PorP/SprF family type IX secretion system membrane protein n=1 Tax=Larkinella soli TaxID=1770527 RepID=UPI000FFBF4A7|nr:type IX secretion system membrane protein PorP/SprF [Larkinella soli]